MPYIPSLNRGKAWEQHLTKKIILSHRCLGMSWGYASPPKDGIPVLLQHLWHNFSPRRSLLKGSYKPSPDLYMFCLLTSPSCVCGYIHNQGTCNGEGFMQNLIIHHSVWDCLQRCVDFTVPLYKWEKSYMQDHYYGALKIDTSVCVCVCLCVCVRALCVCVCVCV